ncbi:MAG: hypothetical protein R3178_00085, partial [Rhodothermales bacterium]|nr:hypothetical protein [Rhodothermales bacterium]
ATRQMQAESAVQTDTGITLETRADTVAMMAYEASGGDAWDDVRYLRFDFAVESNGQRGATRRHLWDLSSGDYRLEWPAGDDTTVVVLFNVNTRTGDAYVGSDPAEGERAEQLLQSAYSRHINDTYWLMAPHKVFDPGVVRAYVADSSSADAEVLQLSFENVGLTPGDRYWMKVDPATGDLAGWTYILQGSPDRTSMFRWTDYRTFEKPGGTIRLSERKEAVGRDVAILTDRVALPDAVPADIFSDPSATMD